jgi:hypothetical protein
MNPLIWILLAALVVVGIAFRLLLPSVGREIGRALKSGEVGGLLAAIQKLRPGAQPSAYNFAIRRLWDSYRRKEAVSLIRELARAFPATHIAQYWLDQLLKVEPALAQSDLGKEFLDTYYQPALAAQCGQVG